MIAPMLSAGQAQQRYLQSKADHATHMRALSEEALLITNQARQEDQVLIAEVQHAAAKRGAEGRDEKKRALELEAQLSKLERDLKVAEKKCTYESQRAGEAEAQVEMLVKQVSQLSVAKRWA